MMLPANVVDALVAKLQVIPDLVAELGGDPGAISAYVDVYPSATNLPKAVTGMRSSSILVVYDSWGTGSEGGFHPINHRVEIYMRPRDGGSYSTLSTHLVNGIPAGQPLPMINLMIDSGLLPMAIEGRCTRELDSEQVEYWLLPISFNETWG
jgi:hypothetical protein